MHVQRALDFEPFNQSPKPPPCCAAAPRHSLVLLGSPVSHWLPLWALAVLAAADLGAQYLAAATPLPTYLHLSRQVIHFLQVSRHGAGRPQGSGPAEPSGLGLYPSSSELAGSCGAGRSQDSGPAEPSGPWE